jgi:hypothetical protein
LADSRVAQAVKQLQSIYPPARVEWLLLQGDARRGQYTGQHQSLTSIFEDLIGVSPEPRIPYEPQALEVPNLDQASAPNPVSLAPSAIPTVAEAVEDLTTARDDQHPALPFASANPASTTGSQDELTALVSFYLAVLLAIAILIHCVTKSSAQDTKAA